MAKTLYGLILSEIRGEYFKFRGGSEETIIQVRDINTQKMMPNTPAHISVWYPLKSKLGLIFFEDIREYEQISDEEVRELLKKPIKSQQLEEKVARS